MPFASSLLSSGYAWLGIPGGGRIVCFALPQYQPVAFHIHGFVKFGSGVNLHRADHCHARVLYSIPRRACDRIRRPARLVSDLPAGMPCPRDPPKIIQLAEAGRTSRLAELVRPTLGCKFPSVSPGLVQVSDHALGEHAWTLVEPARLTNTSIVVQGTAPSSAAYAAVSSTYQFPSGARVAAAGIVNRGGLVLGLLNSEGQWAKTAAAPRGRFRISVQVPAEGAYRVVIANNISSGTLNDAEVTEIGLVGLEVGGDPADAARDLPRQ